MSRRLTAALWGIAAGLLFDSFLLVLTTGWFAVAPYPVLLPVVFGGIVGWVRAGLWRAKETRQLKHKWLLPGLIGLVVWPLCAFGPIGARWLQLFGEAARIPICRGCERVAIEVVVLAYDNSPGFSVDLVSSSDPAHAVAFYRDTFERDGWTPLPPERVDHFTYYTLTKPRRSLFLEGWTSHNGRERVQRVRIGCIAHNLTYRSTLEDAE